jgi:hypothetical protein
LALMACAADDTSKSASQAPAPPIVQPEEQEIPEEPTAQQSLRKSDPDWNRAVATAWTSELGIRFKAYLQTEGNSEQLSDAANAVTDRVFSNADLEIRRIAAIQSMIADLQDRNQYDNDLAQKVALLELDMGRRALAISKVPEASAARALPYLLAATVIGGSPVVQKEIGALSSRFTNAVYEFFAHGRIEPFAQAFKKINVSRIMSKEFKDDYSPISAATAFVSVVPAGLSVYYLVFSRNPELLENPVHTQMSRLGRENLNALSRL